MRSRNRRGDAKDLFQVHGNAVGELTKKDDEMAERVTAAIVSLKAKLINKRPVRQIVDETGKRLGVHSPART